MSRTIERILDVALILGVLWLAGGCNAVHGLGQDLQSATSPYVQNK